MSYVASASIDISSVASSEVELMIPIRDAQGTIVGWLTPITVFTLNDRVLMESITRWRNNASQSFLTHFEATPERTRKWLADVVLGDDSRLLFLIYSTTKLIGHYGFKNLTSDSAEVDNLVRGESGGHPQLVHFAEVALVQWLFSCFGISTLYGFVLGGNWQALELHARVGFQNAELIPLLRELRGAETHFVMGEPGTKSPDGLYSQRITLSREDFYAQGLAG